MDEGLKKREDRFRRALIAAAILTFLVVMAGYLVRFDGNPGACSAWPTCFGNPGIPSPLAARLEMGHRLLALLSGLFTLGITVWAYLGRISTPRIRLWLSLSLAGMGLGALAGRGLALNLPGDWNASLHLALALVVMGLVTAAAVLGNLSPSGQAVQTRPPSIARLSRFTLAGVLLVMVSGVWLTTSGVGNTCAGWPLCDGALPASPQAWLAFGHRLLTLAAGVLVALVFIFAWRGHYRQPVLLSGATGAGLLLAGQVFIGALKVNRGFPLDLVGLHAAASAALWAALIITVIAARYEPEQPQQTQESRAVGAARFKAFVALNKPMIVLLLLATTFAGMVVGGKAMPGFWLAFWTILGGALAAGGASAINQVIDREIDGRMQRTAKRPLPSGALTPAEGLAYGLGACLAAFFIMAGFVNLLAAVLSLAGMIYYVLVYSIWLKHATAQNIVIGGGAGAIPPLVGWAAATGSLNIPALFLFAIVFLWTPPHFWSLAIVRKNDYARAGVPMLPVVAGEEKTRLQIFIYTLELVALTVLMPILNMAGSLFLISAILLGSWLLYGAWNVLRKPGNKVAYTMFRYSSMYLTFIFLALMLDALI